MPVLVVQMGHTFRKTGSTGGAGEQEFAVEVAAACARLLAGRNNWTVRRIPADVAAAAYEADAFFAIHADSSTNRSVGGASVGYQDPASGRVAARWKAAYAARGWTHGFRDDNYTTNLAQYYGVRYAKQQGTPIAIILEAGFLTNPTERLELTSARGADRVALAIGDALQITTPTPRPPVPAQPEVPDDMPIFVKGDSEVPIPGTNNVYGDRVFLFVYDHNLAGKKGEESIARRRYVSRQQDPGFQAFLRAGGKVVELPQAMVDEVPDLPLVEAP